MKCAESKFQQTCSLFDSYFYCFYREWNFNKKSMLKPGWQQERKSVEAMPWWKGREHIGRVGKRLVFCLGNSCEIRGLLLCTQDCLLAVKKILRRKKRLVWQFCQAILAVQRWGEVFSLCNCSNSHVLTLLDSHVICVVLCLRSGAEQPEQDWLIHFTLLFHAQLTHPCGLVTSTG